MRIKRLKIYNNIVLGNIDISFMDNNMNIKNQIFLAGENGCGKTTLLEIIYEFVSGTGIDKKVCDEVNEFTIEFSDEEANTLKTDSYIGYYFEGLANDSDVVFKIDYSQKYGVNSSIEYKNNRGELVKRENTNMMYNENMRSVLRGVYSTAEINFISDNINYVTSKELDGDITSVRQNSNLATEISQLLVDIKALDDSDLADWVNKNPGIIPPESIKEIRIKRFKKAFDYIFEGKKFKGVKNVDGKKEIIFEENDLEVSINKLSSGEKQIVFRGGFLLKDSNKAKGAIILIDEPELSLHPKWQMKIAEFFRRIFEDDEGNQTSQIFISTHSPFILHSKNRINDKVIVLKKDILGNVIQVDKPKFYYCSNEEVIKDAFDIDSVVKEIKRDTKKALIITEGKTDWKHYEMALQDFNKKGKFTNLDIEFLRYNSSLKMSDSELQSLLKHVCKIPKEKKIIGVFDSDTSIGKNNEEKEYGNNTFGICIKVPEHRKGHQGISVELLYKNKDLLKEDKEGRRLYLSNEFQKNGRLKSDKDIGYENPKSIKENLDEYTQKIIDTDVSNGNGDSLALSKENFAENVYKKIYPFSEMDFSGFESLFEALERIIVKKE